MSSRRFSIYKLEISFDIKIAICVLILFIMLVRLGIWQLDRAEEKRELLRSYNEKLTASPITIEALWAKLQKGNNRRTNLQSLRISLEGSYINDQTILLINQHFRGSLGAEIITPVLLSSGDGIALVNRGWATTATIAANKFLASDVIDEHTLVAELFVPSGQTFFKAKQLSNAQWPIRLHFLDVKILQTHFSLPLFPYILRLEAENPGVLQRHWTRVKVDPSKSSNYALQWFAMAFALIVVTVLISTNLKKLLLKK